MTANDFMSVLLPSLQDEDDGVLLVLSVDTRDEKAVHLLVLDAATMNQVGRATVVAPAPVPMPLHGLYVPAAAQ